MTARPLLTIPELATRLAVTERYVRRLVEERRIPYVKIGKYVRFETDAVDKFIEAGKVDGAEWHPSLVRGRATLMAVHD